MGVRGSRPGEAGAGCFCGRGYYGGCDAFAVAFEVAVAVAVKSR